MLKLAEEYAKVCFWLCSSQAHRDVGAGPGVGGGGEVVGVRLAGYLEHGHRHLLGERRLGAEPLAVRP